MPFLQEKGFAFTHDSLNATQFDGFDPFAARKTDWSQPKLAFTVTGIDMDVRRFRPFIGIEVEPPAKQTQDGRHVRAAAP